jgi:hypothetical protein
MNNEECLICMNKLVKVVVLHENSPHKLCEVCYKKLRDPFCPFCRCNIKLHEKASQFDSSNPTTTDIPLFLPLDSGTIAVYQMARLCRGESSLKYSEIMEKNEL